LEKIHSNITEIEHLRTAYLSSINGDASQETAAQLDALVQETSQLNTETKNKIKGTCAFI
jgi:t-SNARE complex subunit (syntaxin)